MKSRLFVPFFVLAGLILLVGLACGTVTTPTAQPPIQIQPTQPPIQVQPTQPPPVQPVSGAVSSLDNVRSATIQIEAQGTFIDPQFGLQVNAAGRGSGFIIDPSGIAVTNNHVVTGAALLKVWVGGDTSRTYNAKVLGVSECSDLAVIDIEGDGFPYLQWREGPISVGLDIYAAGFPLGDPEFTLTRGIVSKERAGGETSWASVDAVIEHDTTTNPGNSGGPLVDGNGQVVGVHYASYQEGRQAFAIGREVAIPIIEKLRSKEDVDSIGVNGTAVVSEDGSLSGIWVSSVKSGSPADKAGVAGGDIITALEGLYLAADGTMADYCDVLRTHDSGDTLSIEVLRWVTQEYLVGQINGDPLLVSSVLGNLGEAGGGDGTTYGDYVTVYDDTGAILMDVPSAWSQTDGRIWSDTWGDLPFDAANITAAPDLDAFNNYYSGPGVSYSASRDWGKLGGYIQLLDATQNWYDTCSLDGRYDYEDAVFEGKYDVWECTGATVFVLSARPIADPTAYLVLVQVQIVSDADLEALEKILDSFDVGGVLP